ncbi:MAG: hypothetical protein NTX65_12475 [Ignavibacteriales bacterium]|nr:hypothetical protein [Ignavibacteriales bacterium]
MKTALDSLIIISIILIAGCTQSKKEVPVKSDKVNFTGVIKSDDGKPVPAALVQIVEGTDSGWQLKFSSDGKIVDMPEPVKTNSEGRFNVNIDTTILSKYNYKISMLVATDTLIRHFVQIRDESLKIPIIIVVKKGEQKVDLKEIICMANKQ